MSIARVRWFGPLAAAVLLAACVDAETSRVDAAGPAPTSGTGGRAPVDAAAGGRGAASSPGAGGSQGSTSTPPYTHVDCFGGTRCRDGGVLEEIANGITFATSSGDLCSWRRVGQCRKGCSNRPATTLGCAVELCQEYAPKRPGDACANDADCFPGPEAASGDGGTGRMHLRCDGAKKTCVEASASPIDDWWGRCDPQVIAALARGTSGVVEDPSCSGGVCVVDAPADRACVHQGCSARCRTDHECPQGSTCAGVPRACAQSTLALGHCKPAPQGDAGAGLTCW